MTTDATHVLWTGGFDSTFRICRLLIDEEREVQPVYATQMGFGDELIFDTYDRPNHIQKPAMPHEIQAIENIRRVIARQFPSAEARLRPIRFVPSRRSPEDWTEGNRVKGPGINSGRQYDLLRLVAEQYGHPIELCIEKSPSGHNKVGDSLMPWVEEVAGVFQLKKDLPEVMLDPDSVTSLANFLHFCFPLLYVTRGEMMEIATARGYEHIQKMTWSCRDYRPTRKPCGTCFCCSGRRRDGVWWPDPLFVSNSA